MTSPGELLYFLAGMAASAALGLVYWLVARRREAVGAQEVQQLTESPAEVRTNLSSLREAVDTLRRPRSFSQTITADGITYSRDGEI
jgi:hypothetical protein